MCSSDLISTDCLIQISMLYIVIGHYSQAEVLVTATCSLVLVIAFLFLMFITESANRVVTLSDNFAVSFLRNDFNLTPANKRSLKASRTIYTQVGSFMNISKGSFPDFILN